MKYLVLVLLLVGTVSAVNVTDACSSRGFAHTVSSWVYNVTYVETYGSSVDVVGTARKLNWTSDEYIDAVVYKSGSRTYSSDGGFNGTIPKTTLSNDISFISFCSANAIPEFGIVGAIIAVLVGLAIVANGRR